MEGVAFIEPARPAKAGILSLRAWGLYGLDVGWAAMDRGPQLLFTAAIPASP